MSDAARSFIDKQLQREPGHRLLGTFAAGLGQDWLPAWVALLGELDEATFERTDLRVAQTKLAWWGEDLASGMRAQHPLSRQLLATPGAAGIAPDRWRRLAETALQLSQQEHSPADWAQAGSFWRPLATCVAELEGGLFGRPVEVESVLLQCQRQRLWQSLLRQAAAPKLAPLAWQAELQRGAPAVDAWRGFSTASHAELAGEAGAQLPLHRALLRSIWQWRMPRLLRGVAPSQALAPGAAQLLWRSWRAAVKVARS
jgi:hypothetical protein